MSESAPSPATPQDTGPASPASNTPKPPTASSQPSDADEDHPPARPVRILVVEDEALTAMDLERLLTELGFEVCGTAFSARDAIHSADWLRPDLVLMDIQLHGRTDGISAAGVLRQQYGIPAVYLTAHADPATRQRAEATQPLGFVAKPYSSEDISAALRAAVGRLRH